MDLELKEAACSGNVKFLENAVASSKPPDYFLSQFQSENHICSGGNMLHHAAMEGRVEFIRKAMEMLPTQLLLKLISQPGNRRWRGNLLHVAACIANSSEVVRLILGFYKSYSRSHPDPLTKDDKPWLAVDWEDDTPLHVAIQYEFNEESAQEIMAMDIDLLCKMVNKNGNSPFFLAVKYRMNLLAERILTTTSSTYSVQGENGSTALHIASRCSEKVTRLMLEKHLDLLDTRDGEGFLVLHRWAEEGGTMDPELKEAACSGDVEFLRAAVASSKTPNYFLSQVDYDKDGHRSGNIFHLAAAFEREEFIRKSITEIFTKELVQVLLSQPSNDIVNGTPLHNAAAYTSQNSVGHILGFYKSYKGSPLMKDEIDHPLNKPWLALDWDHDTPLHQALLSDQEEIALEIMSMDMDLLCNMTNKDGNSPLFLAVQRGLNGVAKRILMSSSYSVKGEDAATPLHFAPRCSDEVKKLLLKKHVDLLDSDDDIGFNALHQWTYSDSEKVEPMLLLLNDKDFSNARAKVCRDLIYKKDKDGDNPLHVAALVGLNPSSVVALVEGYKEVKKGKTHESRDSPPWKTKNEVGNTPLHVAIRSKNIAVAKYFISQDLTICQITNKNGESPLLLAVQRGLGEIVKEILTKFPSPNFTMLRRNDGCTLLHFLDSYPDDATVTGKELVEKFWWISNLRDDTGRTALDEAKTVDDKEWLVELLENPSKIEKKSFDINTACDKDEMMSTILSFIDSDFLHHIKLQTYQDYLNLLKNPSVAELKNYTAESDGATPLHRALKKEDIFLAKALLNDDGVERNIKDNNGTTAMDLLATLYKQKKEWKEMCKLIKVNPFLKTHYIQPGTNLEQMRNTLSIVAALLATITFAAGFTLPGGLDDKTGYAMLAKKPSCLVFILADAYAMCTSMLVLFFLIWSMVSDDRDKAYFLVDCSVFILLQSLYGTMVAFMTGIYTAIAHSSLWPAIVVIIMCALIVVITTNRSLLFKLLDKLIPKGKDDPKEQGRASTSGNDDPQDTV